MNGLCSTHDNYFAIQKTPASIHKAASDKVFNGQYSKAMVTLLNETSTATNEQKKLAMIAKHPYRSDQDDHDINSLLPVIQVADVPEELVYSTATKHSKRGVAPGPNGDRAEYLQAALFDPFSSQLSATVLHYLTRHINLERNGKLSDEWYDISTYSTLVAQGRKLRPIGMGYSGRKLVSSVSLAAASKEIMTNFAPFQLSSLVKNGSETVIHLIRKLHERYGKTHVLLQLDVANAFNSVSRFKGLLAIARHLPQLYTYIFRTYRSKNKLWVDATDEQIRDHILSQEGSTQGAVDGGVFFNMAINDTIKEINNLIKNSGGGTFVAIADDIIGCIKPEDVLSVFTLIEERFSKLNLSLNYVKSTLFSDSIDTINKVDFASSPSLQLVQRTTRGIVILGSTVSSERSFHDEFIAKQISEAQVSLNAITRFGADYLQQAVVLLKSCYVTKFSYLSRVTQPQIFRPFATHILLEIRNSLSCMLGHRLTNNQWNQCLLKPRHGGLGIMNLEATSNGAYFASLLACLPNIEAVSVHQSLGLHAMSFDAAGSMCDTNSFLDITMPLYAIIQQLHDSATSYDRSLSLYVLDKIPSADERIPGFITPEERRLRTIAINSRAADPLLSIKALIGRPRKLQAMFSDFASKVTKKQLMKSLPPEDIIRIHSASDEGAACIQAQPTAPDKCFSSLEFKIYLYLRLGIPIAREDINCTLCANDSGLSNLHLINGCKKGDYCNRKHNIIMEGITQLCRAANIAVESESSFCFNKSTRKRMDLVINIDNRDILIDATTIDADNPSNGFILGTDLSPSYFPGAAAALKARSKLRKYNQVIASAKEFVPFVIEAQGRWGFPARQIFKRVYAKIPLKGSRVSRNFWQQKISIAYMKSTVSNIVHRYHSMKRMVFGPQAPQDLYYFEPYFGQN
jgi:hypothetical protein